MKKYTTILVGNVRAPSARRSGYAAGHWTMATSVRAHTEPRGVSGTRTRPVKLTLGIIASLFAMVALSGCQSLQEKAIAAESATAMTSVTPIPQMGWPRIVMIPPGTTLLVSLDRPLRTDLDETGDQFQAHLAAAVRVDEMTILPRGTEVLGRLTLVADPNRFAGRARMTLSFAQVVDPAERILDISAAPIVLIAAGGIATIDEEAGGGAVLGGLIAMTESSDTPAKSAVIGIAPGAAAGSTIALSTNGRHIRLPASQRFAVSLSKPLRVSVTEIIATR